jgi:ATP-binding cassette, subfamily F, member 3
MLAVSNCSKSFGIKTVLDGISFTVKSGQRVGLVGPNGCGKTTLIRILAGLDRPDSGSVRFSPSNLRVGFLPQGLEFLPDTTLAGFIGGSLGDLPALETRLETLALSMSGQPEDELLKAEYDTLLERISRIAQNENRAPAVLGAFGLGHFPFDTPIKHLSGGQKTRLALAGVLLAQPDFLLLDEPTNHLDIEMLEWLEDWIINSGLPLLYISHDRAFLDHTATSILEMDPQTHRVKEYPGNYGDYLVQKQAERGRQWQEYTDQIEQIAQLRSASDHLRGIAKFRKGGKADSGDKLAKGFFANRGMETIRRARSIEKKLDRLLTDERVDKPAQTWQMKIEFENQEQSGQDVIRLDGLSIGYPGSILVSNINQVVKYNQRLALIGPNGAGKTTLLKTIAAKIPAIQGQVILGSKVKLGFMTQEQENLDPQVDAISALSQVSSWSETEVRSFLSKFLFKGDDVFLPAGSLSFGERSRLSLALLVAQGCNLLLLDEPINHLDIPARIQFESALKEFNGTILAVVHDRYFIQNFATAIWKIHAGSLMVIA